MIDVLKTLSLLKNWSYNIIYHTGQYTVTVDRGIGELIIGQGVDIDTALMSALVELSKRDPQLSIIIDYNKNSLFY
jgi:hypothetical protein